MLVIKRRDLIRVSALTAAGTLAAACAVATPAAPTAVPVVAAPATAVPAAPAAPTAAPAAPAAPTAVPSKYAEAPMLAERVAKGELPPVTERLPENPYVAEGLDGIGKFGGTMRKPFSGQADFASYGHLTNRGIIDIDHNLAIHAYMGESWELSPDASEYTFHLRKGLKWSDGEPLTAADFMYYYQDEILNTELTPAIPETWISIVDGQPVPAGFSAPDDFTVKIKFPVPNALFYLAGGIILDAPATPSHYLKQFHAAYADKDALAKAVKEGGYDDWTQLYIDKADYRKTPAVPTWRPWVPEVPWASEYVTTVRNPYFWEVDTAGNQLPYVDRVTFRVFTDPQVMLMWAANGELDCQARHITADNYTVLKENEKVGDYTVQIWRNTPVLSVISNMACKDARLRALFQQRDYRIAISHAINREEMIELIYDGIGTPMQYAPPKESPLYYPELTNAYLEYDPDKANALLDGLGLTEKDAEGYRLWPDGSKERVSFVVLSEQNAPAGVNLMIVDYFNAVGIEVLWKGGDRSLRIQMNRSNEVQCIFESLDRNLVPLADPVNWLKHRNPDSKHMFAAWTLWKIDPNDPNGEEPPKGHWVWDLWNAYEEVKAEADEAKRNALFKDKILAVWARELPMVGLIGERLQPVLVKNGFKGLQAGFPYDCCTTINEYIIDSSTWYWEEPDKHAAF